MGNGELWVTFVRIQGKRIRKIEKKYQTFCLIRFMTKIADSIAHVDNSKIPFFFVS